MRRHAGKRQQRQQAAMEFMMTYGWAILIIAVVLGVFLFLGVFNSSSFASRAGPGGCYVSRPNGPYSTQMLNLAGACNGEWPQFVGQFNGQSGYVTVTNNNNLNFTTSFSIVLFLKSSAAGSPYSGLFSKYGSGVGGTGGFDLILSPGGQVRMNARGTTSIDTGNTGANLFDSNWHQVVIVVTKSYIKVYEDGSLKSTTSGTWAPIRTSQALTIGARAATLPYYNGMLADIQLYNASLSQSQITALYDEGISGAPLQDSLSNLVAWWPLNGNARDYSGNGNDGSSSAANSISYTSAWTTGYSIKS